MSKDSAATTRTALRRRMAACGLVAGLLVASWFPDARLTAAQPAAGPRLYVFDCGYIFNLPPETYNLTREDVPDPTMSVPCFLVVHPRAR